jgi:nicotinamidase-related amidase
MDTAMIPRRLDPKDTILVVVDMQERLLPVTHDHDTVISNVRLLLRAAGLLSLPVVLTTQYLKGLGPTLEVVRELAPEAASFDKITFSAFGSEGFARALIATERRTVLLCGAEAHICVLQTGLDALDAGYAVHVVADAAGSRTAQNAALGLSRLERAGAVRSSTEMAVYELLGASGTPAFKSLLPHFRQRPPQAAPLQDPQPLTLDRS